MSDAPPAFALLSMVPKWKRHWLKTAPALVLPVFAVVPPLAVPPPLDFAPPPEVVPPDEPVLPAVPPGVVLLDALPPPPAGPVFALELVRGLEPPAPAEAPAVVLAEEAPPEGIALEPPPPWPAFPLLPPWDDDFEEVAPDPPEELVLPLVPPACPSSSPLAQASSESAAAVRRKFRGVRAPSEEDRYIKVRLT